jgi:LemA protein
MMHLIIKEQVYTFMEFSFSTIFWIVIAAVAAFAVRIYNRLVALRQTRKNAFSVIDVQLKQRYDLIPQLLETVKGYMKHEEKLLTEVTEARTRVGRAGNMDERVAAEGVLGGAMMNLFAVAENYPDLKASDNFKELQSELSDIENKIAAARRFFNNATSELNTYVEQFPNVLIARMMNFQQQAFFELSADEAEAAHKAPKIEF